MAILIGLLLVPAVLSQALYGINQLDSYNRIIKTNNLGGLGLLQDAFARGKVHNLETEVLGSPKLSGLPPLPESHAVQRGTPLLDSDALAPPRRAVHKRVVTEAPTPAPPNNLWGVNTIPELPPRHESKLGGYYDEDGEFHEFEKKGKRKENRRKVSHDDDDEVPHVITPIVSRIDETPHPISSSRHMFTAPASAQQVSPHRASKLERRVRRIRQPLHRAVPRQATQPPSTPAPFQYRPKPKAFGRVPEDNNLLAEVEEYDDWLDQREAYQALFPGRRVSNPYENVPPGSVLFENVPPRPENPPQQQQQPEQLQQVPPPPPLNPQFQQQPQLQLGGPFPGGPPFPHPAQLFHSQPQGFPTLGAGNPLFPPHPQLNPTGTHFIAQRAIPSPGADPKRPPAPVQVKPQLQLQPGQRGPGGPFPMPPFGGRPTVPPGTIVSIPPGGQIPPGFFPIAAPPQLMRPPPPPSLDHVLETRDRLAPKSPFENPLVTFFSKLFGKPSGAQ